MLRVVNMIPRSLSRESNQDSEPNIAVDPQNPLHIVATAFTPDPIMPIGSQYAPIFVSTDGGTSWQLHSIVPGGPITHDITVSMASGSGTLYAGILDGNINLNILRAADPLALAPMTVLATRRNDDQPWTTAITARSTGGEADQDRVYIGHHDRDARPQTASVARSLDARLTEAPAGFESYQIEKRTTVGTDGPPIRTAAHPDGTVYAAFQRWVNDLGSGPGQYKVSMDVVVVRDDNWGRGDNPFRALIGVDQVVGSAVASDRFVVFSATNEWWGQERIGMDLAIAVDPTNSSNVWVAWCDRAGGLTASDWTIHVRCSTNRGQTWSNDVRTVTNAKNPALAVNTRGVVGFLFQQLVATPTPLARWVSQLEVTPDAWASSATTMTLHTALAHEPQRKFFPYIGDYIRLLTVGSDFYGVFCGSNLPDTRNFPSGVVYQRNANWTTHTLLDIDGLTTVPVSIDPFFVWYSSIANPRFTSAMQSGFRFIQRRAIAGGYLSGYPSFEYFDYGDGRGMLYNVVLISTDAGDRADVPIGELTALGASDDPEALFRAAQRWAINKGYLSGYPSFEYFDYGDGRGMLYNVVLIKPGFGDRDDWPANLFPEPFH